MVREDFIANGIDYDNAMSLFGGKQEILERFLKRFPNDKSYGQIKEAIAADDCEAAFKAAHTLKGVAGNLSLKDFAKTTSDMTEAFRAGNFEEGKEFEPLFDEQYKKVIDFISQL